ncbi:MAG: tetratricopeptide repeat protein [Rhizobiaceae bacterium]
MSNKSKCLRPALALAICLTSLNIVPALAGGDREYEIARNLFGTGDYAEAAQNLQIAVEKGHSAARLPLAAMYRDGTGVDKDLKKALALFTVSANEGYPSAQFTLGAMYRAGEGGSVNYPLAKKWFLAAARQGDEGSQNNLGTMHEAGRGVQPSFVTALMWYEIAKANGSERAGHNHKRLKRKLTADQLTQVKQLVNTCLRTRYRTCGET